MAKKIDFDALDTYRYGELEEMSNILGEMAEGWIPSDFNESGMRLAIAEDVTESDTAGEIILTNDSGQICRYDSVYEKLDMWYTLPYTRISGYPEELYASFKDGVVAYEDLPELARIFDVTDDMSDECDEVLMALEDEEYY